jgi:hypothetical protein
MNSHRHRWSRLARFQNPTSPANLPPRRPTRPDTLHLAMRPTHSISSYRRGTSRFHHRHQSQRYSEPYLISTTTSKTTSGHTNICQASLRLVIPAGNPAAPACMSPAGPHRRSDAGHAPPTRPRTSSAFCSAPSSRLRLILSESSRDGLRSASLVLPILSYGPFQNRGGPRPSHPLHPQGSTRDLLPAPMLALLARPKTPIRSQLSRHGVISSPARSPSPPASAPSIPARSPEPH